VVFGEVFPAARERAGRFFPAAAGRSAVQPLRFGSAPVSFSRHIFISNSCIVNDPAASCGASITAGEFLEACFVSSLRVSHVA
jgi:hypothetical protein